MNDLTIALLVAVIGPLILTWLTGRQRKTEKEQDWARQDQVAAEAKRQQDEVAAQAAEAARLLLERQEESNRKTDEVARLAAEAASTTDAKLGEIGVNVEKTHGLVNSQMDEQKRKELAGLKREHALGLELIELRRETGGQPSQEAVSALESTKTSIVELELEVKERGDRLETVERGEG